MARLTKADAARQLGISRTTLYKLIDQGKVSATPDGLIDSTELVRVAPVVDILKERARTSTNSTAVDTDTRDYTQSEHLLDSASEQPWTPVHERLWTPRETLVDTLRAQVEDMRHELHAARAERQVAHAERQAAQEERALLLQMLQQMQQRYDRLLEAPRVASVAPARATSVPMPGPVVAPKSPTDRGAMRRRILELVRDSPEGLTPAEIRTSLGVEKRLSNTCLAMLRDGLLRRVGHGRYVAREE